MPVEIAASVCEILSVSPTWLLLGDGPQGLGELDVASLTIEELTKAWAGRTVALYERAEATREALEETNRTLALLVSQGAGPQAAAEARARNGPKPPETLSREDYWAGGGPEAFTEHVPIVNIAAAGAWADTAQAEAYEPGDAEEFLDLSGSGPPAGAIAVRLKGSSMEPQYHGGDLVVVDTRKRAACGRAAVIIYRARRQEAGADAESEARVPAFKIYRHTRGGAVLESLNPAHGPIGLADDQIVAAWPVLEHLRAPREKTDERTR